MTPVMRTPRTIDIELTSRCNLRCRYCYYMSNEGVHYHDMPTSRWLDLFDEMGRANVMSVCVSGGEALMHPDFRQIIEGIIRNRMRFQVLTNGRFVTPELAEWLKATGRLDSIQVSLDGPTAEPHEVMRGKGSFAPALSAIRLLHEKGLPITVRATIHARNIEHLPALAHLLLEEIGLPSFSTNAISSLGTHAKYGDELFLPPALRLRAMHVLAGLDKQYPGRIQASAGPLAEWHMFNAMKAAQVEGKVIAYRGRLIGCGCIFTRMAVRADGAYIPCVMLPQMVLGWAGQDAIEEVWRNAVAMNTLRSRIDISLSTFDECAKCEYRESCTGNCAGTSLSYYGEANRPSPEGCLRGFEAVLAEEGLSLWQ